MTDKNDNAVTTAPKQQKKKVGRPFVKGQDARRNIKGRPSVPKSQVELNALIDELLAETSTVKENGRDVAMSKARILLNKLILSKSPVGQIHILDRRFGKVAQVTEIKGEITTNIIRVIEHDDGE
jgi:hypothetical protein